MIRCHVEQPPMSQSIQLWFYLLDVEGRTRYLRFDGEQREWIDVPEGAITPAPSLTLHHQEFEALVNAANEFEPASKSQAFHLKDAIAVRDRLLKLVEEA